jgi:hypothetical protein
MEYKYFAFFDLLQGKHFLRLSASRSVICREISDGDRAAVALCLKRNFPRRTLSFWQRLLQDLSARLATGIAPRVGYLVLADRETVAVLLTIGCESSLEGAPRPRFNVSSWCADPLFRSFATMLTGPALARRDLLITNLTPAPHTIPHINARGFRAYANGSFVASLLRGSQTSKAIVRPFDPEAPEAAWLSPWERTMLSDHRALGLEALVGVDEARVAPFVLRPAPLWRHRLPAMQLLYSRSEADLVHFAQPLGRRILRRRRLRLVAPANAPIAGLVGEYFEGRNRRYYRGPEPPAVTDLAYSELALI